MLSFIEKTEHLKTCLEDVGESYADSFKTDILFYFGDLGPNNMRLKFLEQLTSKEEIEEWVAKITSKIVLKFNEDEESLGDFLFYYNQSFVIP